MKKLIRLIVVGSVFIAVPLRAADQHDHSGQQPADNQPATKAAPAPKDQSMPMAGAMKENMDKMRQQMTEIRQTKDPKERERLMQEHMKLMMRQMEMMDGMKMDAMKGGDMMKGCEGMASGPQAGKGAANCMAMMQQRLGMMHEMMNQVLQQQQMMMEMMRRN